MSEHLNGNDVVPLLKPEHAVALLRQQKQLASIGSNAIVDGLFSLLEGTPGLATITDIEGSVLYMNDRGQETLGVAGLDGIYGHWLGDVYSKDCADVLANRAIPFAISQGTWRGDMTMVGRGGDEIPVSQVIIFQRTSPHDGFLLSIAWDMRDQKRKERVLRHLATHDELTGLPNRTLLLDRLNQALNGSQRDKRLTGIAFLDLDRFKTINDWLGHENGNRVLIETADRVSASIRSVDTVGRYGGDEFVLVLPNLRHADQVDKVLQRIDSAFEAPFRIGNRRFAVTLSTGRAIFPADGADAEALLDAADRSMYRAKRRRASNGSHAGAPRPGADGPRGRSAAPEHPRL